ncbi:hypothetical protein PybrP1_011689 [[Pythium] brassicae (nom. inval.)]|nr:hypothetical protein PybrP1_011689 [[Pythium] brassicae (nom. inval.)]
MTLRRMKISTAQGLALLKSRDGFELCVVHALAVALIMEAAPSRHLLSFMPLPAAADYHEDDDGAHLLEVVERIGASRAGAEASATVSITGVLASTTTTPQPTPAELQQRKKKLRTVLEQAEVPTLLRFAPFDPVVRTHLTTLTHKVLRPSIAASNNPYPLNDSVAEFFAASALLHFPEVSTLFPSSPYVAKISLALFTLGIAVHVVQMWSTVIRASMLKWREKPAREAEHGARL